MGLGSARIRSAERLRFTDWFPEDRLFTHGSDDYSATLAAIKRIRALLPAAPPVAQELVYEI